jgi:hypothetical protein
MAQKTEIAMAEKGTHRHRYIFPNFLAKMMSNVDPKTQYESAMLSSFLILLGILATSIMMVFFMDFSMVYKILIALNCIGGFLYISSSLITVYQQYANYMDIMEIQKSMMVESANQSIALKPKAKVKKKYNRWNQFVFFLGVLLIIGGICLTVPSVSKLLTDNVLILVGYVYYLAGVLILLGVLFDYLIIRSGRKKLQKAALIDRLIREGKIVPKKKVMLPVESDRKDLSGRLKGLISSIKTAKEDKRTDEEEKIRIRMKEVLDEIKRLKLSERRS